MPISAPSQNALRALYPQFYTDLKYIGNPRLEQKIVKAINDAVAIGEEKFKQVFGGWFPDSAEFGINPLRPGHINKSSNRWTWTSGATSSIHWSASDTFVSSFSLDDNEIMMVYGYFNMSPVQNIIEIQMKPGNVTLPVLQVQPMRMKEEQYLIFPEPVLVNPRSPFAVDASCISTSTVEEAGLLGYFFAPCSTLITKEY
jgi:hypothetical protein